MCFSTIGVFFFFIFKQKTAYEMRISDWIQTCALLILIVDGEPNASDLPGREAEECFAPALRFELDATGRLATQRAEPIAADARPDKDGKANAKLKLIAGMLGVGFDVLKQRELRPHARRMTMVATLAATVMTLTHTLAVHPIVSRTSATWARHASRRRPTTAKGSCGLS